MPRKSKFVTLKDFQKMCGGINYHTARSHAIKHCQTKRIGGNIHVNIARAEATDFIKKHTSKKHTKKRAVRAAEQYSDGKIDIDRLTDPSQEIDLEEQRGVVGLDSLKDIVTIRQKEASVRLTMLKMAVRRGELIDRKVLEGTIFTYLDALNRRLLDSAPQSVDRMIAAVKRSGDEARAEMVDTLLAEVSKAIKSSRREVLQALVLLEGQEIEDAA